MFIKEAIVHGLVWAAMWSALVLFLLIQFPASMLSDYPKEIQEVAHVPELNKKQYRFAACVSWIVIFAYYIFAVLLTFHETQASYLAAAVFSCIVFMMWNIVDLLILDWLMFCTIQPKFMVLPGSEGHPQYKNYRFHFFAFCKGTSYAVGFGAAAGGILYGVLRLWFWD
jgi:uncharacterized membrane protein (DUF485 family)